RIADPRRFDPAGEGSIEAVEYCDRWPNRIVAGSVGCWLPRRLRQRRLDVDIRGAGPKSKCSRAQNLDAGLRPLIRRITAFRAMPGHGVTDDLIPSIVRYR